MILRGGNHDADVFEHLRDEGRDRRALRSRQRDVGEQRMALERLDHRGDAVVPPDPQVVALRDVVGEDDAGVLPDPRQDGEQYAAFQ